MNVLAIERKLKPIRRRLRFRMDARTHANAYISKNNIAEYRKCGIIELGSGRYNGSRLDDDDDGRWITTEKGHRVHLNEEGDPDKGNPKVISVMKKGRSGRSSSAESKGTSSLASEPVTKKAVASKTGEVKSGKTGKFRPKSDSARVINTSDALDEIRSGKQNSLADHMDEYGDLSPERQAVHDEIVQKYFADKIPASGKGTMIMSGGGPASGKSFITDAAKSDFGEETVVKVDPDDIKAMLPGYKEMAIAEMDLPDEMKTAASFYHEESSALAKRIYQYAADNGVNVVYDGTGDGSVKSVASKIKVARDAGYAVNASYVTVDVEEALKRNKQRYENALKKFKEGKSDIPPRLPPVSEVMRSHAAVSDISIQTAHLFDHWELWDNNVPFGSPRIKLATCTKDGEIVVEEGQEERMQAFLDKGQLGAKVVNRRIVFKK